MFTSVGRFAQGSARDAIFFSVRRNLGPFKKQYYRQEFCLRFKQLFSEKHADTSCFDSWIPLSLGSNFCFSHLVLLPDGTFVLKPGL